MIASPAQPASEILLRADEVGRALGPVSAQAVRRWVREGVVVARGEGVCGSQSGRVKLACTRIPCGIRFTRAQVEAFRAALNACGVGGASGAGTAPVAPGVRPKAAGTYPPVRGRR